jgi:Flp pilus assembly pilin Flp
MKRTLARLWREQDGSLSFEWTMVLTLLVIGIVSGLAAARDAIIDVGDVAQAAGAIDQIQHRGHHHPRSADHRSGPAHRRRDDHRAPPGRTGSGALSTATVN